jgi:outer membrane protein OmpA-like peptidoglycan-associated protein
MKKIVLFIFQFFICLSLYCQITVIGHDKLNNSHLINTTIIVKEGSVVTKTLHTKASSDFLLKLEFGKNYQVYFENQKCSSMFLTVTADNVPEEKYYYKMVYELDVPFFDKRDEDIDSLMLKQPFQKIIFDGKTRMVEDTAYTRYFYSKIIKQTPIEPSKSVEKPGIIAGTIFLNNDPKLTVNNANFLLLDKNGKIIKSTSTNRFGSFSLTGVIASQINKFKLNVKEVDTSAVFFTLMASNDKKYRSKPENGGFVWQLLPEDMLNFIDNNFTTSIGGKLIASSPKSKKFFANKTVYLTNRLNTILKKTKTNVLGTFVFEDLKPDNNYFVGVDSKELSVGEKIDVLNKDDQYVATLDTVCGGKALLRLNSGYNKKFDNISINDDEMTMTINARLYGDNTDNPIGRLKVLLLNDSYLVIDSAITDDLGAFKFKYLPFFKRFYLTAENNDNILDVYKSILIYNKDSSLVKIMMHEKGNKFTYKPLEAEINRLRDVELEDPWLDFVHDKKKTTSNKLIIENILFESGEFILLPQAKEILDKVILVLNANKKLKIEIGAHTDSKGSDSDNLKLSQMRAKTALSYILSSGVTASRVASRGYGESKLLNNCGNSNPCNELEHAKNRRIEFKILDE